MLAETAVLSELSATATELPFFIKGEAEEFVVQDKFTAENESVEIIFGSGNFSQLFGALIEDPSSDTFVYHRRLVRKTRDSLIFDLAGGVDRALTKLRTIYALMVRQNKCQIGELVTTGEANVFFVKDVFGQIQAISLHTVKIYQGKNVRTVWKICVTSAVCNTQRWTVGCQIHIGAPFLPDVIAV
jgi:hypothetical protein